MTGSEKALIGLECLITNEVPCEGCPYNGSGYCLKNIAKDARELLKEHEPRVMTLEEVVSAECVWIEYAVSGNVVIAFPWDIELTDDTYNFICNPNSIVEFKSLYGEEWRCWTSRPTDEQREAVKWDAAD